MNKQTLPARETDIQQRPDARQNDNGHKPRHTRSRDIAGLRAASTRAHSQITSAGNPINTSGITVSTLTDRTLAPQATAPTARSVADAKHNEPHTSA